MVYEDPIDWHPTAPWTTFKDPRVIFSEQPTFLAAEILFFGLTVIGLFDVLRRPRGGLTFTACLVGGTAVELLTILHKQIGDFYHSQATIMLFGRREPLYMLLGCYGWIAYCSQMIARSLGETPLVEAALAALLGSEAWALLDTIGAQFQWWHWHNSEPLYEDRDAGVPVSSAFWIMASCGALALTLRACPDRAALGRLGLLHPALGVVAGPFAYLGLMHVPFLLVFHPIVTALGYHALYAQWALRAVCALPLLRRLGAPRPDRALLLQMSLYVLGVCALSLCDPTKEVRSSFGQPCVADGVLASMSLSGSACDIEESCFWGAFKRKKFVCAGGAPTADLFRICDPRCNKASPGDERTWYTSCGVAPEEGWHLTVLGHACVVLLLALLPFRPAAAAAPAVEGFKLPEPPMPERPSPARRESSGWIKCPDGSPGYVRVKKVQ